MHKWTCLTTKIKNIYKEENVGKQGDMFLAGQESRDCTVFSSGFRLFICL